MTQPLPPGIEIATDPGGRSAVQLSGPDGRARIGLLGAHVQSYVTRSAGELLFMSEHADFGPGVASRGGIPVVFPWFGAAPPALGTGLAAHGFARVREWSIARFEPGPSVTLGLRDDESTRALWPHAFEAELEVSLGEFLKVALTVKNRGEAEFTFEEALHTYLRVGDIRSASVHGFENTLFQEFAKAPQENVDGRAPISFTAETDRVFQGVPDASELRCPALGYRVDLRTQGARSAIVWNPWTAKAAAMVQMRDDEFERFVCVETANCKAGSVTLVPGASHRMELRLSAKPMPAEPVSR